MVDANENRHRICDLCWLAFDLGKASYIGRDQFNPVPHNGDRTVGPCTICRTPTDSGTYIPLPERIIATLDSVHRLRAGEHPEIYSKTT